VSVKVVKREIKNGEGRIGKVEENKNEEKNME
jgi:hypothetical protein